MSGYSDVSQVDGLMAEDDAYVKAFIAAFYDESVAARISVNESVVILVAEMLDQASDCTEWLSYIPKPVARVGVKPGLKWALKQVRRIGQQLLNDSGNRIAFACKKAIATGYRQRLEMAAAGLM